jgi:hypothetical protein
MLMVSITNDALPAHFQWKGRLLGCAMASGSLALIRLAPSWRGNLSEQEEEKEVEEGLKVDQVKASAAKSSPALAVAGATDAVGHLYLSLDWGSDGSKVAVSEAAGGLSVWHSEGLLLDRRWQAHDLCGQPSEVRRRRSVRKTV